MSLAYNPNDTFRDNAGVPVSNGTLVFWEAGTTNKLTVYSDSQSSVTQNNPYTLDAYGRTTADLYFNETVDIQLNDENGGQIRVYENVAPLVTVDTQESFSAQVQRFLGSDLTSGNTVITLTDFTYVPGINSIDVFINGVYQFTQANYEETSSTVVTLKSGVKDTDYVVVKSATITTNGTTPAASVTYGPPGNNVTATNQDAINDRTVWADDRDSIQDSIDLVEVGDGGSVVLTPDTSYTESALTVSDQNVTLASAGDSNKASTVSWADDVDGITANGASYTVKGLKLKGSADVTSSTKNGILLGDKYWKADNLWIEQWSIGFHAQDTVMSVGSKIIARGCKTGFKFDTACTSLAMISSWANCLDGSNNAIAGSIGWDIDGAQYSNFISDGVDSAATEGWRFKNCFNVNLLGSGSEGTATEQADQSLVITDGCQFMSVIGFFAFRAGNAGQGAIVQVTNGTGTTGNITIDGLEIRNPNAAGEDDYDINCTGPVWIKNSQRRVSGVPSRPTFTNAIGLAEYRAQWEATMSLATSGTATLSPDTLTVYRNGNQVTIAGKVTVSAISAPTGACYIDLPFNCAGSIESDVAASIVTSAVDLTGYIGLVGRVLGGGSQLRLQYLTAAGGALSNYVPAVNDVITIGVTYTTDDGYTWPSGLDVSTVELNQ